MQNSRTVLLQLMLYLFLGGYINMTPENLLRESEKIQDIIVRARRTLHRHAETGFDLNNTISFVKNKYITSILY